MFPSTAPKPGLRGLGTVQHAGIKDPLAAYLAQSVFGALEPDAMLYPASASSFRRRWDKILLAFGIPASAALTPACCRPGGAV